MNIDGTTFDTEQDLDEYSHLDAEIAQWENAIHQDRKIISKAMRRLTANKLLGKWNNFTRRAASLGSIHIEQSERRPPHQQSLVLPQQDANYITSSSSPSPPNDSSSSSSSNSTSVEQTVQQRHQKAMREKLRKLLTSPAPSSLARRWNVRAIPRALANDNTTAMRRDGLVRRPIMCVVAVSSSTMIEGTMPPGFGLRTYMGSETVAC